MKSINTRGRQKMKEGLEMKAKLMGIFKDEEGQAMTEYGLIIALIAVVVIVVLTTMGDQISAMFTKASDALKPKA